MEGAPNDGTSAGPTMTPIERQMQVIATSIQDLARETSRQNQELWQAIRKRPPAPMTTTNLPRGEKTGRTTKKLTAIKSPVAEEAKWREPHPRAGAGQKARPVPLHPANIRQQNQTGRLSSQNDRIGRPNSLNDKTNRTIRPDNQIVRIGPQEIRMTKRHAWRKNCEK
jgi:hypothetical protein